MIDGGELDVDGGRRGRHQAIGCGRCVHLADRRVHAVYGVVLDGFQVVGGEGETWKRYIIFLLSHSFLKPKEHTFCPVFVRLGRVLVDGGRLDVGQHRVGRQMGRPSVFREGCLGRDELVLGVLGAHRLGVVVRSVSAGLQKLVANGFLGCHPLLGVPAE